MTALRVGSFQGRWQKDKSYFVFPRTFIPNCCRIKRKILNKMMVASRAAASSSGTANQPGATLVKPTKPKGRPLTMDEYFDRLEVG